MRLLGEEEGPFYQIPVLVVLADLRTRQEQFLPLLLDEQFVFGRIVHMLVNLLLSAWIIPMPRCPGRAAPGWASAFPAVGSGACRPRTSCEDRRRYPASSNGKTAGVRRPQFSCPRRQLPAAGFVRRFPVRRFASGLSAAPLPVSSAAFRGCRTVFCLVRSGRSFVPGFPAASRPMRRMLSRCRMRRSCGEDRLPSPPVAGILQIRCFFR